ncbi:hypothetical protein M0R19_05950 [Candidatus Pacearchaeota archaeon]|jgi:hypothetical protein|nr:hypothetical protein [Candidatus Pacearchaeota archaeon]
MNKTIAYLEEFSKEAKHQEELITMMPPQARGLNDYADEEKEKLKKVSAQYFHLNKAISILKLCEGFIEEYNEFGRKKNKSLEDHADFIKDVYVFVEKLKEKME